MSWQKVRPIVDIMLGAMLIFEMLYMLTGNFLHEVVGALFFATLIAHIILSRNWIKGILIKARSRQHISPKQKARMTLIIVLCIALVLLLASSVLISNILGAATGFMLMGALYHTISLIHAASAYTACIATICHVGLHWAGLLKPLRIPYDPRRRKAINAGVTAVASLGVIAVGLAAAKELGSWSQIAQSANASTESEERNRENRRSGSRRKSDAMGFVEDGSANSMPPNSGSTQGEGSAQIGGGSSSGICTLCGKRCSLSSPKCNKPYAAGLI